MITSLETSKHAISKLTSTLIDDKQVGSGDVDWDRYYSERGRRALNGEFKSPAQRGYFDSKDAAISTSRNFNSQSRFSNREGENVYGPSEGADNLEFKEDENDDGSIYPDGCDDGQFASSLQYDGGQKYQTSRSRGGSTSRDSACRRTAAICIAQGALVAVQINADCNISVNYSTSIRHSTTSQSALISDRLAWTWFGGRA